MYMLKFVSIPCCAWWVHPGGFLLYGELLLMKITSQKSLNPGIKISAIEQVHWKHKKGYQKSNALNRFIQKMVWWSLNLAAVSCSPVTRGFVWQYFSVLEELSGDVTRVSIKAATREPHAVPESQILRDHRQNNRRIWGEICVKWLD